MSEKAAEIKRLQCIIDRNNELIRKKREDIQKIKEEKKALKAIEDTISKQQKKHVKIISEMRKASELRFITSIIKEGQNRINSKKYKQLQKMITDIEKQLKIDTEKLEQEIESLKQSNISVGNSIDSISRSEKDN